jgi:Zn finger protein HypA/HybF involved in hydrogenase expression
MKNCPNCNVEIEDSFEICWNCSYSLTENRIIDFEKELAVQKKAIDCIRCGVKLLYSGYYQFHEGKRLGVLGNLFELFVNRESFDIYVCPKCGKVEFYVPE